MKFKLFALMLALSLMAWAQDTPSTSGPNATAAPETKSCCHHAAAATDAKDGMSCCHHSAKDATDAKAECCGGDKCAKDAKSCCGGKEMASGKSCCGGKDMKDCAKACAKSGDCAGGKCCAHDNKSATSCCGSKCGHSTQATSASLLEPGFDRR